MANYESLTEEELVTELQRLQAVIAEAQAGQDAVRLVYDAKVAERRIDGLVAGLSDAEIRAIAARVEVA